MNKMKEFFLHGAQKLKNICINVSNCNLCHNSCQHHSLLCNHCLNDINTFDLQSVYFDLLNWPAIYSLLKPVKFDRLVAIAPHEWPFSLWISKLKYHGHFEYAPLLGNLLAKQWEKHATYYDISPQDIGVISVPIYIKKWQHRGYNQSYLIAESFCKLSKIHHYSQHITRIKEGMSQVGKSGIQRRKNLKEAFSLSDSSLPSHIILIDDVITTGTTTNEISSLLKKSGVKNITVATITLALPTHKT